MATVLTLPQADPNPAARAAQLAQVRALYAFQLTYDGHIATINQLPACEKPGLYYHMRALGNLLKLVPSLPGLVWKTLKYGLLGCPFRNPQAYRFFGLTPLPEPGLGSDLWNDYRFGRQRVAGPNPVMLQGVNTAQPLPPQFQVWEAKLSLSPEALKHGLATDRLYQVNYAMLQPLKAHLGSVGNHAKYLTAPIALFYLEDSGQLRPLAIQLDSTEDTSPENPILTPTHGKQWQLAQTCVQAADAVIHDLWTHAVQIHYVLESIIMVTYRQLGMKLPLLMLLDPHLQYTLSVNVNPLYEPDSTGKVPYYGQMFPPDNAALVQFMGQGMRNFRFRERAFPNDLKQRHVTNPKLDYPYRDAGQPIWDATLAFAAAYVDVYYKTNADVVADYELQAWAQELGGERQTGACGLEDFPTAFSTREEVAQIFGQIIFMATAHHAAVHYPQIPYTQFVPNMPNALYNAPTPLPSAATLERTLMRFFPPYTVALFQAFIYYAVNFKVNQVGEYALNLFDPPAVTAILHYQRSLKTLAEDYRGKYPADYPYLNPAHIPNGVTALNKEIIMLQLLQTRLQNWVYQRRYQSRNFGSNTLSRKTKLLLGAALILILVVYNSTPVQSILQALRAPHLPALQTVTHDGKPIPQTWLAQNWGGSAHQVSADTQTYHHLSQGTATLMIPYAWFAHLEEPDASLWSTLVKALFFIGSEPFARDGYLLRFGFIRGASDPIYNPDGLPIGFAKAASMNVPGYPTKTESVGFTCAACHTGHIVHGEGSQRKEYIIEGGPATVDLGQLTLALGATLGQTALSSRLPVFDGRFDRFARGVLGPQYSALTKGNLAKTLISVVEAAAQAADTYEVQEGFGRLDALNRIGNQVFAKNVGLPENYHAIDAPVNYPFIWTSSWFKWVQYDGSIMAPLVRNAGEAMGVMAQINMTAPKNENPFESSIPLQNVRWIENFLKGQSFNQGLTAPRWPFAAVDTTGTRYLEGKTLYQERCVGCHLPVVDDPAITQHLKPIQYVDAKTRTQKSTLESVLDVHLIPLSEIGTDSAQANILVTRTLNTAGNAKGTLEDRTRGMGLERAVCTQDTNQIYQGQKQPDLVDGIVVNDGGEVSFALGLGALVQQTIDAWFDANFITDPALQEAFLGGRPNCLQAGQGYKARPLNGVWATAPFLHNGSVATLHDLLCKSQDERPAAVRLGDSRFDAEAIGLYQPVNFAKHAHKRVQKDNPLYTREGYFILDTSLPGNSNRGHSFDAGYDPQQPNNAQKTGVIGSKFTPQQCSAILEYLKTL